MDYVAHWKTIFTNDERQPELVGSLHENGLNSFLTEHHRQNSNQAPYRFKQDFTFFDGTQDRKFTIELDANTPLRIDLSPIVQADPSPWNRVVGQNDEPGSSLGSKPNLGISMEKLGIKLSWPKLAGGGDHTIELELLVEGTVRLYLEQNLDGRYAVFAELHKVRFSHASVTEALNAVFDEFGLEEEKCKDLLVIVLNIIANQYGPQVVQAIEMPAPAMGDKIAMPVSFDVSQNAMTIGFDVDRIARMQEVEEAFDGMLARYQAKLLDDIEKAGGLENIFFDLSELNDDGEPRRRTREEVAERLVNSRGYVGQLEQELVDRHLRTGSAEPGNLQGTPDIAIGFNEYALDLFAQGAVKQSDNSDCTKWLRLGIVKGRACHWSRIRKPDVDISGDSTKLAVKGSVHVDFGGKIEACVRRVYKCSKKWDCGSIGLSLQGPAVIKVTSRTTSKGLSLVGSVDKLPKFKTKGVPWPFSKVIEEILDLVLDAARIILNLAARFMTIRIVTEVIDVPSSNTDLKLSGFKSHYALIDSGFAVMDDQKKYAVVLANAKGV